MTGVQTCALPICYEQPPEQRPVVSTSSPVLAKFDAEPMRAAILGLWHECCGDIATAQIHHWVELVHNYVLRFAQPWRGDDRLWKLWEKVAADLTADWTLERLAAEAHLSREHLRRLCRRQLGRSPRHHVTYLRMRRAVELLGATLVAVDGNHDREARDKDAPRRMHADAADCLDRNRQAMTSSDVAFLRGLPEWVQVGPFTVAHDPAGDHGYVLHPEDALETLHAIRTPHAIVGHTHWPGYFEARGAGVDDVSTFTFFEEGDEVKIGRAHV